PFPIADADGLRAGFLGEFPVDVFVLFLTLFAEERGDEAEAVSVGGRLAARQLGQSRHYVPECAGEIAGDTGGDFSGPAGDRGDADAAFIDVGLVAAQRARGVEEFRVEALKE